ncbi:uncharacterized protein LOC126335585 [Schistocerca gregaria]|uniref:uncharacterized protein LOC126335585 n=1 Tax=Schistocerca gregaria TaxID=7010 RepID=UPI00211E2C47|nr:uncharacterized protein LOC126335585 [Schistocerca gregaria]
MLLDVLRGTRWLHYDMVIGGDLNADFDITTHKRTVTELKILLRQCSLHSINNSPTRDKACLDNIFVNFKTTEESCDVTVFPFSDHDCASLNYTSRFCIDNSNIPKLVPKVIITRSVTDDKIVQLCKSLAERDWFNQCHGDTSYSLSAALSGKLLFERFFKTFLTQFNDNIPIKKCKLTDKGFTNRATNRQNSWFTKQLSNMKNQVMVLHNICSIQETEHARLAHIKCRNEYKKAIVEAKKAHNFNTIDNSTNKCKAAWKLINGVAKDVRSKKINKSPQKFNDFFIKSVEDVGNTIIKPDISSS